MDAFRVAAALAGLALSAPAAGEVLDPQVEHARMLERLAFYQERVPGQLGIYNPHPDEPPPLGAPPWPEPWPEKEPPVTLEAWVKVDAPGDPPRVSYVLVAEDPSHTVRLWLLGPDVFTGELAVPLAFSGAGRSLALIAEGPAGGQLEVSVYPQQLREWHHVAVVWDSQRFVKSPMPWDQRLPWLYVDGTIAGRTGRPDPELPPSKYPEGSAEAIREQEIQARQRERVQLNPVPHISAPMFMPFSVYLYRDCAMRQGLMREPITFISDARNFLPYRPNPPVVRRGFDCAAIGRADQVQIHARTFPYARQRDAIRSTKGSPEAFGAVDQAAELAQLAGYEWRGSQLVSRSEPRTGAGAPVPLVRAPTSAGVVILALGVGVGAILLWRAAALRRQRLRGPGLGAKP